MWKRPKLNGLVRGSGLPTGNGAGDMTNTQRMLMDHDRFKKLKSEDYYLVKRATCPPMEHHGGCVVNY